MKNKGMYSKEEQKIIIEEIQQSPHNLAQAFEAASHRLKGRNKSSVSGHYYSTLKPLLEKENIIVTQLSTTQGSIMNTKTVARKESEQFKVIKQLASKLNSAEQKRLITQLFEEL